MIKRHQTTFVMLTICVLLFSIPGSANESIYQFDSNWVDQNNEKTPLTELQGETRLIAFVYTYCEHTCPLIIAQIKAIIDELPGKPEDLLRVTLFTLDPTRDSPSQMKSYMNKNNLNESLWKMLSGDPSDIQVLSNLFGVKYRVMRKDELAHSNMISLVDKNGVIQYQLKGLDVSNAEITEKILEL